ncbi:MULTISPECIES: phage head closure protein [unclassified Aminobacter]|uniref:phage head closure protein n=1 Tax=unclassified Aminobacter TaxID=2644704 RepID=UPI000465B021|nr:MULTISPECIES: phage head closure protein [unclassified Aminobacter]TWH35939.1 SPP1 family predicted phage head-tail adaptor [Aminobacter sp. J15]
MRTEFVDPGAFRHQVILEAVNLTPDGAGGHHASWTEVATFFARIEPVAATSRFGGDQTLETVTHRVTIRFRADIASSMRLKHGSRILEILTVHDPDETGRYLICRTREIGR